VTFKEKYLEMKEKGLTDYEIAEHFNVCRDTITRWKKRYDVSSPMKIRHNKFNVPEHVIQMGVKNGISRRLLLRRIREYGFTWYQAVHTPLQKRRSHAGLTKHEKRMQRSDRQKMQYEEKKKKEWRG
jgi:transposase